MDSNQSPIFTAVSSSARQLFLLLRCIGFSPKAEVQITSDGLRFSVEESRAVQGLTFLEKILFSSYTFNPSFITDTSSPDETASTPSFQINLTALLETLQIFGLSDTTTSSTRNPNGGFTSSSYIPNAFNTPALAITGGTCRISYPYIGGPLSITISEAGVTTTCDLNTYESSNPAGVGVDESIPLQRDALTLKIIMRSIWLFDAVTELASTNPTTLILTASNHTPPLFALEGAGGPFGDSIVDFRPEPSRTRNKNRTGTSPSPPEANVKKQSPLVTETFSVLPRSRVHNRYTFAHIQKAARAMALASKVCIRCDGQGVLSLQFLIELGGEAGGSGVGRSGNANADGEGGDKNVVGGVGGGKMREKPSFVDFRFVPLVDEDGEEDLGGGESGDETEAETDR